jgi:hypothetical protein
MPSDLGFKGSEVIVVNLAGRLAVRPRPSPVRPPVKCLRLTTRTRPAVKCAKGYPQLNADAFQ